MLDRNRRKSEIDESVAAGVEAETGNDGSPEETGIMPRKAKRKTVFSSRKYRSQKRPRLEISTDEEIAPDMTCYIDTDEVPAFSSLFVQTLKHDHDYCVHNDNDEGSDIYAASINMDLMKDDPNKIHAQTWTDLMEDPEPNVSLNMGLMKDDPHKVRTWKGLMEDPGTVKKTLGNLEKYYIAEVVVNNCVDFSQLQNEVQANISQDFIVYKDRSKLILVQMYLNGDAVSVKLSIELLADFTCNIFVHRRPVPRCHTIWEKLPLLFDRVSPIMELCRRILKHTICIGNPDKDLVELLPIGGGFINNFDKSVVAYREEDFNASYENGVTHVYSSTIRSTSCELLISKRLGKDAVSVQITDHQLNNESPGSKIVRSQIEHSVTQITKHSDMTKENILQKIQEQKIEIELLESELCQLKEEYECLSN